MRLVVSQRFRAASEVVALTLRSPAGTRLPDWQPGAHIGVACGPGMLRQYSLCGPLDDPYAWRIGVLQSPGSRGGSRFVHQRLFPGVEVQVTGPRNNFELVAASAYRFVAGGIGITPMLPMIETAQRSGVPWRLDYGGRSLDSMAFVDEVSGYGERVRLWPADQYPVIDLDRALEGIDDGTVVYCCGPEGLLTAMRDRSHSWMSGTLHLERFTPVEQAVTDPGTVFEVVCQRSGRTVTVGPGRGVLEVLEAAGIDVPSSCREGTCGTCETTVIAGEIDHRDSLLSEDERAVNDTMMVCVSRALSDRLVLDV
jgi:ferredoxin-NADP reductase